jgi:hypothetical protein
MLFFYKHSLGNQRDVIKGNGCLSKHDSTYRVNNPYEWNIMKLYD